MADDIEWLDPEPRSSPGSSAPAGAPEHEAAAEHVAVGGPGRRRLAIPVVIAFAGLVAVILLTALRQPAGARCALGEDRGDVEVFVEPDSSFARRPDEGSETGTVRRLRSALEEDARVDRFRFVDRDEVHDRFLRLFADTGLGDNVDPTMLPVSFRLCLDDATQSEIEALDESYANVAGVLQVVIPDELQVSNTSAPDRS